MSRKLLIDVDTGVDDAHAIILALSRPNVDVIAITCVAGNTNVDKVCENTLNVLKVCNRMDVPVYRGACKSILGEHLGAPFYHGEDGLGDVLKSNDVDTSIIQSEHAVTAMLRLVGENPGEISIVALAPLTNIALATRIDPHFGEKLKSITIMGGNIDGKGNSTLAAEYNFESDPEAAAIVLKDIKCMINLVSWETNLRHSLPFDWVDKWLSTETEKGRFVHDITQKAIHIQHEWKFSLFWNCDLVAMATAVDEDVILEVDDEHGIVELQGKVTRGQLVVDWMGRLGAKPNIRIIKKIDMDKVCCLFQAMLL
ncbi:hypothetical protein ScPMuIL_005655 [Solemya velum]